MNVEEITGHEGDYRQVKIVIGGDGQEYDTSDPHFEVSGLWRGSIGTLSNRHHLILLLPDSVAEYFRQQGRRQLRREINLLLNP